MKDFIKLLWAWIAGGVSFVMTLSGFIALWKDKGVIRNITIALFAVGILICWLSAIYIYLKKSTKELVEFPHPPRSVKVPAYGKWQRRLALAISIILPLSCCLRKAEDAR